MTKQHDRRRLLVGFAGLSLLGGALLGIKDVAFPTAKKPNPGFIARVVKVTDGDTIHVRQGEKETIVRLAQIDAPEHDQPFGEAARIWLARECSGGEVRIVESGKDRYGRTIGDVHLAGRWLNKALVERGYAWHYTRFSQSKELAAAEADARKAKRGLWIDLDSSSPPVPPWEWRNRQKQK